MRGALRGGRVRVAELGRPGQIQKVKVEGGAGRGAGLLGSRPGGRLGRRSRSRARVAANHPQEDESEREGPRLHGGRIRNLIAAFNRGSSLRTDWMDSGVPCGGLTGRSFRVVHLHVSHLSREKRRISGRAPEGAQLDQPESAVTQQCLSADDSCVKQNHTSICCLRLRRVFTED